MGHDNEDGDSPELSGVLEGGAEMVGSLPGAAVGFLIAGPPGALIGGAMTPVVVRGLKAAIASGLAYRSRDRAAAAALIIDGKRRRRSDEGEELRDDGFFEPDGRLRPDAEELLEGVLREAAESYEERKVPLLANLYSGVEHDESVATSEAFLLLRRATQLTYRQFVALSVFAQAERYADYLIQTEAMHNETSGHPSGDPTIDLELSDLSGQHLLGTLAGPTNVVPLGATWGGVGNIPAKVGLGQLRLLPVGERLARLTGVETVVADHEREEWLEQLRGPSTW